MRSHLIADTTGSSLDPLIVDFVHKHPEWASWLPADMRVGLKNKDGELYRLIIADGVIEMIRADKFLMSLGCVEEVSDEFDCLFRVPL